MTPLLPLLLAGLPRLVVPGVEGHNVSDDLRGSLTDALVAAVRRQAKGYDVLGSNEVQSLLHVQAQKQQLTCHDSTTVNCLVEIGGALGAERMVFGALDRVGKSFFWDAKLIDVPHARVLQESSATVGTEDELLAATIRSARELFAGSSPATDASSPAVAGSVAPAGTSPAVAAAPSTPTPSPAPADGLAVDAAKVYSGPDGLEVDILWLKPRTANQALVRVTGGSSPFENKVLLCAIEDDGGSTYFITQYHGRRWSPALGFKHSWSDALEWEAHTPGMRDGVKIVYDKAASAAIKAAELLAQYRSQRDSGELAELARFDRKAEEQGVQQRLADSQLETSKACGSSVPIQVDWASVTDEVLKKYSIDSYCEPPFRAMRQRCENDPAFKQLTVPKLKKVTCHFGSALALDFSGGTLAFTTAVDAPNQDSWAFERLKAMR